MYVPLTIQYRGEETRISTAVFIITNCVYTKCTAEKFCKQIMQQMDGFTKEVTAYGLDDSNLTSSRGMTSSFLVNGYLGGGPSPGRR
jgi:hypothetical protein